MYEKRSMPRLDRLDAYLRTVQAGTPKRSRGRKK